MESLLVAMKIKKEEPIKVSVLAARIEINGNYLRTSYL